MKRQIKLLAISHLLSAICLTVSAQTTAFTYQGQLNSGATNANGRYDLRFAVYDANVAGNFIAGPITNSAVAVSNGLFTVTLDFGAGVFTGTNYWVEMAVRTNGSGSFNTLVPRQQLSPAPYALSLVSPQATALCPVGSIMAYMGTNPPPGWLLCNGAYVSRTQYGALFAVIGTSSGYGDNSTTFRLPDTRGLFLRGWNAGTGRDPDAASRTVFDTGGNAGDTIGSYQDDGFKSHTHSVYDPGHHHSLNYGEGRNGTSSLEPSIFDAGFNLSTTTQPAYTGITNYPSGGNETRPRNFYVNYIIKY